MQSYITEYFIRKQGKEIDSVSPALESGHYTHIGEDRKYYYTSKIAAHGCRHSAYCGVAGECFT